MPSLSASERRLRPAPGTVRSMARGARAWPVRRLLVCLGVGALAPLGSIRVGSFPAAAVVGLVLAIIAWMVWGMLDSAEDERS